MAIIGKLELVKKQNQNIRLHKAIEYLETTNLHSIFDNVSPDNKQTIEIEGRQIFAIFQEYNTKIAADIKIEGHKKYIDIQYIFSGEERILLSNENDIVKPGIYNREKDIHFPDVKNYSSLQMRQGDAVILFPEDLHGPCYCIDTPARVKKIVVKVAVDL